VKARYAGHLSILPVSPECSACFHEKHTASLLLIRKEPLMNSEN